MRATVCLLGCAWLASAAAAAPSRPPAPAIAPGPRTFAALAGQPAAVRLAWTAAPNVARYRARWTQAGATVDVELPGTATAFERSVSAAGHHQLTVVAIDATGRESPPAEIGVDVVAVTAIAPGADAPAATTRPGFALGARFRSPGLTCRLGDDPAGEEATARQAGATTLRCGGEPGPRVEVPVVIAPVIVDGPRRPIARGAATRVHLTVASVAPLGERLEVEADGDVAVGDVRRTAHGLEVAVTPRGGATAAALVVRSRGIALGRVELAIGDAPASPAGAPAPASPAAAAAPGSPAWLALDLGYHLGMLVPRGEPPAIGSAAEEISPRPIAGASLGLFPTRRVGVEAELALAAPDRRPGQLAWLVSARAHLAARVLDDRFGLRLVAGAGTLNATGAVHYGGALTFEARENLWLRLQALHAITVARDAGYAHCLELQLGVVTRFGRRDRGW